MWFALSQRVYGLPLMYNSGKDTETKRQKHHQAEVLMHRSSGMLQDMPPPGTDLPQAWCPVLVWPVEDVPWIHRAFMFHSITKHKALRAGELFMKEISALHQNNSATSEGDVCSKMHLENTFNISTKIWISKYAERTLMHNKTRIEYSAAA